jgi:hypothetical protein
VSDVLYVYAVTDSLGGPLPTGLHGAPLRRIESGSLAAVVSGHPLAPEPDEETLWAHEQIVEDLMASATILPLRFGSTVAEVEALTAMLAERHDEFLAALERVRGAVEVSVRAELPVLDGEPPPPRSGGAGGPEAEGSGTAYLLARAERERRGRDAVGLVHRPLAALSRQSVAPVESGDSRQFKASYLVEEGALEEFGARVGELNASLGGVKISATGPWPPYNFVAERSP